MPVGLFLSLVLHAAVLGWALISMGSVQELPEPDVPAIDAALITPSEFLRLKQGADNAKHLETAAKEEPKPDDSKNDTKKPDNAPAPPPTPSQEDVAALEPPPPPEPEKAAEPPKVEPEKTAEPPPPPQPAPGPTPDEQKALEQKLEEQRKADEEAKKKAEEEAAKKKKAEEEAKKKKLAEEAKKKKLAEEKRKREEAKKKFDPNKIASLLDKAPDDATPKALVDKDPTKKGQQASGTSQTATAVGKEAGTATGTDTVLSLREQDLLKGLLRSQLSGCWRPPGTAGGADSPVVSLHWEMNPDGSLKGEPRVTAAPSTAAGQVYAEAALRAVKSCAPFRLPPDKYEGGWRYVDWSFDPREML